MKRARYFHINNGVGSGNIGDELMAQEFWKLLPAGVVLDVPVLPDAARYRGQYPKRIGILRSPLPLRSFLMWLAF